MRNIAIIPARSGSKGLKDKNIKMLDGKPLISYSIQAALQSGCFEEVMVSTDSEHYAEIAQIHGASVPFLRSAEMSSDSASSWDSVREVLKNYLQLGQSFDNVMLLQPTSPLRTSDDIINAFDLFFNKKAESVVGVCEMEHSPLWSNVLPEDGNLFGFLHEAVSGVSGRQGLPTYYRINGAIYLTKINYNDLKFNLFTAKGYAYCMPRERSLDIDELFDFSVAETVIRLMKL